MTITIERHSIRAAATIGQERMDAAIAAKPKSEGWRWMPGIVGPWYRTVSSANDGSLTNVSRADCFRILKDGVPVDEKQLSGPDLVELEAAVGFEYEPNNSLAWA